MKIDTSIFKAYDIRGIYPEQINKEIAYAIGQGYVDVVKPDGPVVVGHDVRIHSEELKKAMIEGLLDAGVDVVDIGLISTEMIYFATGNYGFAGGIQVTASHNPAEYHGAKLVKRNAEPISSETGILEIRDFVLSNKKLSVSQRGSETKKDILDDYCAYLLTWFNKDKIKKMRIVANANFGFEGEILDRLIEIANLPLEIIKLNYDPDGTFPKGRPDPFILENRGETVELVKKENADFGVAWDADADRVFFCANDGTFLDSYYSNVLLIEHMLKKNPNSKIIYDPRYTWALIEATQKNGGVALLERVGHAFIKARMRKEDAIFSGESSGHTYYRDFWYADSGMIPFLQILEIISKDEKTFRELVAPILEKFPISGEINFITDKSVDIMKKCEEKYSDAEIDRIDGLSFEYGDWRFNLRTSNTEPLLRLNMEAKNKELLNEKLSEVKGLIGSYE